MMWFYGFLLLPAVFASIRQLNVDKYLVKIDNDALSTVELIEESASNEVNLAGLGIKKLNPGCFRHLTNVTHLNLANNSIDRIDENVFSETTHLEYLSLANNGLTMGDDYHSKPFKNLYNLKTLDLSNNQFPLRRFFFHGLSPSCSIIIRGTPVDKIESEIFQASSGACEINVPFWYFSFGPGSRVTTLYRSRVSDYIPNLNDGDQRWIFVNDRIKICMGNGIVTLLDTMHNDQELTSGCKEIQVGGNTLYMREMNITGFAKGWFRLQSTMNVLSLDFTNNEITAITPEVLNDLPRSVITVVLMKNKIERVERGVLNNPYLTSLVLRDNGIKVVEDGAFEKLSKIEVLFLDKNHLTDINFLATVPASIRALLLNNNEISEIPAGIMSKFKNLLNLELHDNRIEKVGNGSFVGLSSLELLRLGSNRLQRIGADALSNIKSVLYLDFSNNSISSLDVDTFDGMDHISTLNLRSNKFTKIPKAPLSPVLLRSAKLILLDDNEIEKLEVGSFIGPFLEELHIQNNKIREIEHGAFNLPKLDRLELGHNLLTEFDGDSFSGLPELTELSLYGNRIEKCKNALKHLPHTGILDLSNNLFTKLENGDLAGMCIGTKSAVYTTNTPIEFIQPGMFDTVQQQVGSV